MKNHGRQYYPSIIHGTGMAMAGTHKPGLFGLPVGWAGMVPGALTRPTWRPRNDL